MFIRTLRDHYGHMEGGGWGGWGGWGGGRAMKARTQPLDDLPK